MESANQLLHQRVLHILTAQRTPHHTLCQQDSCDLIN